MSTPGHRWLEGLLAAGHGQGGARLAVLGQWDADRPYWAGLRLSSVQSLLEAVLRGVLAAPYERVVVCSGFRRDWLPKGWLLAGGVFVGDEAAIWLARGTEGIQPASAAPRNPWESELPPPDRGQLIWHSAGRDYKERLEQLGRLLQREIEVAKSHRRRTAVVIDGGFFHPRPSEWTALRRGGPLEVGQAAAAERAVKVPATLTGSPADVILFSEDANDEQLVLEDGHLLAVIRTRPEEGDDIRLPKLRLGPGFESWRARRQAVPFATGFLDMDLGQPNLYRTLRGASLNPKASVAARPENAERVSLEFWADLDLERPRRVLDEDIIGQEAAKKGVLTQLEQLKALCRKLLDRDPDAVRTADDRRFLPPVLGLFGAAGMGKTTFCKALGRSLLGDEVFFERLDLAGKDIGGQTIGIAPPGAGYDQRSPLIRFAERTAGLGVVCIDEFTRAQRLNQQLADALGPLLQILQERFFAPANGQFRPPGGRFHLVNTVFVFAGNVVPADQECPAGFTSLTDLGPAFAQRVAHAFYFESLQEHDFSAAIDASLRRGARDYALDFERDRANFAADATVTEALRQAVLQRFREAIGGNAPSLRALQQIVDLCSFVSSFDALKQGGDHLVLDSEVLGGSR